MADVPYCYSVPANRYRIERRLDPVDALIEAKDLYGDRVDGTHAVWSLIRSIGAIAIFPLFESAREEDIVIDPFRTVELEGSHTALLDHGKKGVDEAETLVRVGFGDWTPEIFIDDSGRVYGAFDASPWFLAPSFHEAVDVAFELYPESSVVEPATTYSPRVPASVDDLVARNPREAFADLDLLADLDWFDPSAATELVEELAKRVRVGEGSRASQIALGRLLLKVLAVLDVQYGYVDRRDAELERLRMHCALIQRWGIDEAEPILAARTLDLTFRRRLPPELLRRLVAGKELDAADLSTIVQNWELIEPVQALGRSSESIATKLPLWLRKLDTPEGGERSGITS